MVGPLEGLAMDKIRELIETNLVGTIAVIQAVPPETRERGSGVMVNVTSGVTIQPLPLMSIVSSATGSAMRRERTVPLALNFSVEEPVQQATPILSGAFSGQAISDNKP